MSAPTRNTPLRLDDVDRLRDVAGDLIAERDDGVAYPCDDSRQAVQAFVSALREEPAATLRALQLNLQRAKIDAREAGRTGRGGPHE